MQKRVNHTPPGCGAPYSLPPGQGQRSLKLGWQDMSCTRQPKCWGLEECTHSWHGCDGVLEHLALFLAWLALLGQLGCRGTVTLLGIIEEE